MLLFTMDRMIHAQLSENQKVAYLIANLTKNGWKKGF